MCKQHRITFSLSVKMNQRLALFDTEMIESADKMVSSVSYHLVDIIG